MYCMSVTDILAINKHTNYTLLAVYYAGHGHGIYNRLLTD